MVSVHDSVGDCHRFMQMTRFVERSFHTESIAERDEWMDAYAEVQKELTVRPHTPLHGRRIMLKITMFNKNQE